MWIARGIESNKVYAKNKVRSEVFRELLKKYPSRDHGRGRPEKGRVMRQVLPEPMTITKGGS